MLLKGAVKKHLWKKFVRKVANETKKSLEESNNWNFVSFQVINFIVNQKNESNKMSKESEN